MRLDKFLAEMGLGTRKEIKAMVKRGEITVSGEVVSRPELSVGKDAEVEVRGERVRFEENVYYMLNKPAGILSASRDRKEQTVVDLIDERKARDLFPVGRLDRDTVGLLLITNDGLLSHQLLSPKKHVPKTYFARVAGQCREMDVRAFAEGLDIGEEQRTRPAVLEILSVEAGESEVRVTVTEGKFHQIKRMFEAVGKEVLYLKRLSMGTLHLDESLPEGGWRRLTEEELAGLRNQKN